MLCDWLLTHRTTLATVSALEIGSGVGLVATVAATCCRSVVATDYRDDVLVLLQQNIALNGHLYRSPARRPPLVRKLNLLEREHLPWAEPRSPDPGKFEWSSGELEGVQEAQLFLASDVRSLLTGHTLPMLLADSPSHRSSTTIG